MKTLLSCTHPTFNPSASFNPLDQVSTCGTAHPVSHSLSNACGTSEMFESRWPASHKKKSVDFWCTERRGVKELQCLNIKWWKGHLTRHPCSFDHQFPKLLFFQPWWQMMEHGGKWHVFQLRPSDFSRLVPNPCRCVHDWAAHAWSSLRAGRPHRFFVQWKGSQVGLDLDFAIKEVDLTLKHACFTINKCRNEAANRVGCYLNITTKKTYWHVLKNLLWDAMGMYGSNSLGPAL